MAILNDQQPKVYTRWPGRSYKKEALREKNNTKQRHEDQLYYSENQLYATE